MAYGAGLSRTQSLSDQLVFVSGLRVIEILVRQAFSVLCKLKRSPHTRQSTIGNTAVGIAPRESACGRERERTVLRAGGGRALAEGGTAAARRGATRARPRGLQARARSGAPLLPLIILLFLLLHRTDDAIIVCPMPSAAASAVLCFPFCSRINRFTGVCVPAH